MRQARPIYRTYGICSLVLAMLIFFPAVAPFTPSVLIVFLTIPLAIVALTGGAWRTSVLALLWSCAAILISPMNKWAEQSLDIGVIFLGAPFAFVILSGIFYANYRASTRAT